MKKLSVVLATFNEEKNIAACLTSVKDIADEIIIVDGTSSDNTVSIAKEFGAKVIVTDNPPIFHINKQKALEEASSQWILQLDADERVSKELAKEITLVTSFNETELTDYEAKLKKGKLFSRHTALLEQRDGKIGESEGEYVAFFLPRLNYFLGHYLRHGGVYPDGVIRLVKNGTAHFPCKSVHEQIAVDGRVGWLDSDLIHIDSPTFSRYLMRWGRYTSLIAKEIKDSNQRGLNTAIAYLVIKPIQWFFLTFFRHKGFLDLWPGFVFSLFSSLRFPMSYLKYLKNE